MANIEVKEAPTTAFEIACNMAQVVKTLVGRPIQVAIVKGLNRKLKCPSQQNNYSLEGGELTRPQWRNYSIFCPSLVT